MIDFALSVLILCLLAVVLSGTFIFVQIALERFLLSTLPIIADVWLRLRYPDEVDK